MTNDREQWFLQRRVAHTRGRLATAERRAARVRSADRRAAADREVTRLRYRLAQRTAELRAAVVAAIRPLLVHAVAAREALSSLRKVPAAPAYLRPATDAPVLVLTAPRGPTASPSTVLGRAATA